MAYGVPRVGQLGEILFFLWGMVMWGWRERGVTNQDLAGQALSHLSSVARAPGARGQGSYITKISNCQQ